MPRIKGFTGERGRLIWKALQPIINQLIDSLVASLLRQLPVASSTTRTAENGGTGSVPATTEFPPEVMAEFRKRLEVQAQHVIAERLGLEADDVRAIRADYSAKSAASATGGEKTPQPDGQAQSGNSPTESSGPTSHPPASVPTGTQTHTPSNDKPHTAAVRPSGSGESSEMAKARQFAKDAVAGKIGTKK